MQAQRGLVIDDDPVSQNFLRIALERRGFNVDVAQDGMTALDKLSSGPYAVILLDYQMPLIDGKQVLTHLRTLSSSELHSQLSRVIVVTGSPPSQIASLDLSRTCGVLRKPVNLGELHEMIDLCVQRQET